MNDHLSPKQLTKLPKWLQEYIEDLKRDAFLAKRTLKEYRDTQTPSSFYIWDVDPDTHEMVKHFIQTNKMTIDRNGLRVEIILREDAGIDVAWSDESNRLTKECALIPMGLNSIRIKTKNDMR